MSIQSDLCIQCDTIHEICKRCPNCGIQECFDL